MERIFYPYWKWEDYKNGLFEIGSATDEKINSSIKLLSEQELFWDVMCQMQIDWKYCFEHNLSNTTQNRKSWLGQAACNYQYGNEFNVTIIAWNKLNEITQYEANQTAIKMIELFERENGKNTDRYECSGRCKRTLDMDF